MSRLFVHSSIGDENNADTKSLSRVHCSKNAARLSPNFLACAIATKLSQLLPCN